MFVLGVLKCGVPNSVQFCTGDLPIYIPTHPYFTVFYFTRAEICFLFFYLSLY